MLVELQLPEPFCQSDDGHLHQVANAPSADFHIVGLGLQTCAVTSGTGRLSPVSCHHHAVLYLVLVILHHLEELVDTRLLLLALVRGQPVPQPVFLLARQVHVRLKDGEVVDGGMTHEPLLPLLHLLTVPAYDAAVIYRERRIGDDKLLVDADDASESLTLRTGTHGRIEGEKLV